MSAPRTYWHLESSTRKPTEYDVATSRLLYYCRPKGSAISGAPHGLELTTPAAQWIERYQRGSLLQADDWEPFEDPRQTTYTSYVELQRDQETYLDGLLRSISNTDYDAKLSARWIDKLGRVLPTLRFPLHGLQMISAYIGHLAPSGRIAIAALLQTGDEIRRIQRIAYRMRELQNSWPGFGESSRDTWQRDCIWQPLRERVEKLLVTYDWAEALVALNLCLKPAFDHFFTTALARAAEMNDDPLLGRLLAAFEDDCRWHQQWSQALIAFALQSHPSNKDTIAHWQDHWRHQAEAAVAPLITALET